MMRLGLLGLIAVCLTGCSREAFRQRADRDVEAVITQKNIIPNAQVQNWHAYPDPRARFANPPGEVQDYPPYPPDDYYAWLTSPNPQRPGRGGAGRYEGQLYLDQICAWDASNRAEDEANRPKENPTGGDAKRIGDEDKPKPADAEQGTSAVGSVAGSAVAGYLATFASNERAFRIRFDQAVELALFNSREFQDRREDLYLAALPVTFERFTFAAQAFASEQLIRQSTGRDFPGGGSELWTINGSLGFNRRFATGAELLVRLANTVVIDLSGPNPTVSLSNLALTFTQPFLRGGGYAVTLENLTQAERTLLYAIRSYARFRSVFYNAIVGNGDYTNNPYGLQGLSANLGRGVGANLTARATGFLPTILLAATLANQRKNVAALEDFLKLFQNLKEGGGVNELQVNRVEQNLLQSRSSVLISTQRYLDSVDFVKLQLGVPATLPLEFDDGPLRPVRLQLQQFERVYEQLRDLEEFAGKFTPGEPADTLRTRWSRLLTDSTLARGTRFAKEYPKRAEELRTALDGALLDRLAGLADLRRRLLDARADRQLKNIAETPETLAELEGVEAAVDLIRFEQALRRYEIAPWQRLTGERRATEQALLFRQVLDGGVLVAVQPRNQQLERIRGEWPQLPSAMVSGANVLRDDLDTSYRAVARAGLNNRLDLMNARAQVVDGYRQINVSANSLLGVFDVQYDFQTRTPQLGANGLAFAQTRSQNTLTINAQPPFVRRAERNAYRASLISYQRSRRNLQAFEDNIVTDSRVDLRNLRQLGQVYYLQQRAVELAYAQVDNARATLVAPPDPAARETAGNVAALTQQLLEAQSSLLTAQNNLFTTWINYQTTRLQLYLDLELLPLDARGLFNDAPPAIPSQANAPADSPRQSVGAVRADGGAIPGSARPPAETDGTGGTAVPPPRPEPGPNRPVGAPPGTAPRR